VVPVVAGDQFLQPGAVHRGEHRRHIAQLNGQGGRRGDDVNAGVQAPAEPGLGVGEQDHAQHGDRVAAAARTTLAAEELLEQAGRLAELHARRAPAPVGDRALLDEVPVAVELAEVPVVAVAAHRGVEVLALDGDQAGRAEQQVVDLAAAVAVPPDQYPVVAEHLAELDGYLLLTGDAGPQDLLGVRRRGVRRRGVRRRGGRPRGRYRGEARHLPDVRRAAEPGEPVPLRAGAVPRVPGPPEQ